MDQGDLKKLLDDLGYADTKLHPNSNVSMADLLNDLANDPEASDINRAEQPQIEELSASMFKESADEAFKAKNYRNAVGLYTHALNITTPTERDLKRTILANRSQSYIFYGDIHSALQDVNNALSPEFPSSDSTKRIVIKCHIRKAKLLCMFARYEEATEEYEAAQALRGEGTNEDKLLKKDIDEGLAAPKGSKRQRKDELLRAVDARGIIVQASSRTNFPTPPSDTLRQLGPNFQPDVESLRFVTRNEETMASVTDTSNAQVAFPVFITAPYFQARPDQGNKPFRTRGPPVSESMTVGMLLDNLFSSHLFAFTDEAFVRRAMPSAVEHEHPEDRLIIMPTHRGRLLVIDPKMTFREVFSGATWPRNGPLPREDLRKVARAREHEVDGIELVQGWHLDIIVITKAHLQEFVTLMENGPRAPPS